MREIQMRGGILIDCINGDGFDKSIIGNCLIGQLNMEQIAAIDCDSFPSISRIIQHSPNFPLRIYANQSSKVGVIISDFEPSFEVQKPLGRSLIAWSRNKSIALILSFLISSENEIQADIGAICSTSNARARLEQSRIDQIESAKISGLPAVLLNEGNWNNFDVVTLAVPSVLGSNLLDSQVETIIQGIDVLLPEIKINFDSSLYRDKDGEITMNLGSSAKS